MPPCKIGIKTLTVNSKHLSKRPTSTEAMLPTIQRSHYNCQLVTKRLHHLMQVCFSFDSFAYWICLAAEPGHKTNN